MKGQTRCIFKINKSDNNNNDSDLSEMIAILGRDWTIQLLHQMVCLQTRYGLFIVAQYEGNAPAVFCCLVVMSAGFRSLWESCMDWAWRLFPTVDLTPSTAFRPRELSDRRGPRQANSRIHHGLAQSDHRQV